MFTIENKNLKKNWKKKLPYFILTLFSQLLPHIVHCSDTPDLDADQNAWISQIMGEGITSENPPYVCGKLEFNFGDPQDNWDLASQLDKKTNSGGEADSKIRNYADRSPYARPTAKMSPQDSNDDDINFSRFRIATEQEREGQHDLANYNYHLSFFSGLPRIQLGGRGGKMRQNKRIRAQRNIMEF